MDIQKPWSIQIELVEGCNRRCWFCGIKAIRKHPMDDLRYMDYGIAKHIADGIKHYCPDARIEFAMHGEPTLHPKFDSIVTMFRNCLPKTQFQITTNGQSLITNKHSLNDIFDLGIDIILVDTYYPERDGLRELVQSNTTVPVYDFYDNDNCPSPWHNYHRKLGPIVILMDDLGKRDGQKRSRVIMNHAGNAQPPVNRSLDKVCTLPFREMSICYNGDVCICCMDWKHELVCGNVMHEHVEDVWTGAIFESARRILYSRKRTFIPCNRCNAGSGSRVGLLPKYHAPDTTDFDVIENAKRKVD